MGSEGFLLVLTGCQTDVLVREVRSLMERDRLPLGAWQEGHPGQDGGAGKAPWSWEFHAEFSTLLVVAG